MLNLREANVEGLPKCRDLFPLVQKQGWRGKMKGARASSRRMTRRTLSKEVHIDCIDWRLTSPR
jgi:hypothetical protein